MVHKWYILSKLQIATRDVVTKSRTRPTSFEKNRAPLKKIPEKRLAYFVDSCSLSRNMSSSMAHPEHVRTVCLVVIAGILSAAALHWLEKVMVGWDVATMYNTYLMKISNAW